MKSKVIWHSGHVEFTERLNAWLAEYGDKVLEMHFNSSGSNYFSVLVVYGDEQRKRTAKASK